MTAGISTGINHTYIVLTPACVGTPAGSAGFGNPFCKRDGGSTTCSVREAFTCIVRLLSSLALMGPMALSTCSEGADLIGPGGWSQCVKHLQ